MQDKSAKAFLEKHPEFDNKYLEQNEIRDANNTLVSGSSTLLEPREDDKDFGDHMLDAVHHMKEGPAKILLTMYYNGASNAQMAKKLKIKNRAVLDNRLVRAKKSALRQIKKAPKALIFDQEPLATKVFVKGDQIRFIYLVRDEISQDHLWVDEKGIPFPANLQDILDKDSGFKEWDAIYV
ncbi:MAG: hypothetical protein V4440_00620 [Pseudomonadota bacterium]